MNKSVLITGVAKEDITQIAEYIATDNKNASIKIVTKLLNCCQIFLKLVL